ncbi:CRISPR-associated helicase Cas3' [Thermospira aquatica]|uniref:CRISPR-associated helicase Cas3 n=1 Tax=Thermospira aquatica TaxID=2828656 RepID=A0AAX3BFJ7_9SPIR|nr:CRISPR-associated helicase Cas3' [Thermospira aquatica]URA11172.1 CRISPR-associated helicase Cas3' [Thermospira aquatica]
MCSSNLYSHPDVLLEDHLIGVAQFSELFLCEKPPEIQEELRDIVKIIALTHDIGKATSYFQCYLKANDKEKEEIKKKKETHHSLFSAICAYFIVKEKRAEKFFPLFSYIAVKRHHGDLIDVLDEISLFTDEEKKLLLQQLDSIDEKSFKKLASKLKKEGLPIFLTKECIRGWIENFPEELKKLKKEVRNLDKDVRHYLYLNFLYSLLLDADKNEVVVKTRDIFERKTFNTSDWVNNYKKNKKFDFSSINPLREEAYQEVMSKEISLDKKIYSLNLPTGLGKTLISLSFALKLREKLKNEKNIHPRIIYALPFLSIIEQNFSVFESVIKSNHLEPTSDILLKHHHLSGISYQKENNEFETDEAKILIEGWNSEIIVTTFMQLFHTLISNQNKNLRKFHKLSNSIIILDEVQSIPIKYWSLLQTIMKKLSDSLNVYIIFATATEPLIFEKNEITSLVNKDSYFSSLNRVLLIPVLDKSRTLEELFNYFQLDNGKSYLFIFNTIASAKRFYEMIENLSISHTFLSTHITPRERLQRIREIKANMYQVVITTQLVEAGVDIDFDIVVRDMAPLDSINQAAGRCNRNNNSKSKGVVYVFELKDDNDRTYASYIYDCVLLDITKKILSEKEEIKEDEFLKLIEDYYNETKNKKTQNVSKNLLEAIEKLKYDTEDKNVPSISAFKLIEEDYNKIDVFIEFDDIAKGVWQDFLKIKEIGNRFLKKQHFDSIKDQFYQYVICVPASIKNSLELVNGIYYLSNDKLREFYDLETGFITEGMTSSAVVL